MAKSLYLKLFSNCRLILCLQLLATPVVYAEADLLSAQIQDLDSRFKDLSSEYYRSDLTANKQIVIKIEPLFNEFKRLAGSQEYTNAIRLLYSNIETLKENIDHPLIFEITDLLLQRNEWNLATLISGWIADENDQFLSASIQFIFAKYHASRKEWSEVIRLLTDSISESSSEQASLAHLLYGTALQHLKQHRKASENYSKIQSDSVYYIYAQLNSAIANIRQGWLAEARSKIKRIIPIVKQHRNDQMLQRLYLVLGYAYLQKEYYRDARDSFRQVKLNSLYANRALLGIGLSATSQGDYVGGLNALAILKEKKALDLAVDESYLIIPYVYEKLQQEGIISASYSEAMNYYQDRLQNLDELQALDISFKAIKYDVETSNIEIRNTRLDYGKKYPDYFFLNYQVLTKLPDNTSNSQLQHKIELLKNDYEKTLRLIMADLITQRKDYLGSYLSQSRYGLARLYDNNQEEVN